MSIITTPAPGGKRPRHLKPASDPWNGGLTGTATEQHCLAHVPRERLRLERWLTRLEGIVAANPERFRQLLLDLLAEPLGKVVADILADREGGRR